MPHRAGELSPAPGRRAARIRLLLGVAVGTLTVAGALAPATAASASTSRAATVRCDVGTGSAVAESYSVVFSTTPGQTDPVTSTPGRAERVQGGNDPAMTVLIAQWLGAQAGPGSSIAVSDVRCVGRRRATARTELLLGGTPMPKVMPRGGAVLDQGVWKVTRATFCERMRIENPALASAGPCATRSADRARPLPTTTPSRVTLPPTTTTVPTGAPAA